jgi:hypothetical protein
MCPPCFLRKSLFPTLFFKIFSPVRHKKQKIVAYWTAHHRFWNSHVDPADGMTTTLLRKHLPTDSPTCQSQCEPQNFRTGKKWAGLLSGYNFFQKMLDKPRKIGYNKWEKHLPNNVSLFPPLIMFGMVLFSVAKDYNFDTMHPLYI